MKELIRQNSHISQYSNGGYKERLSLLSKRVIASAQTLYIDQLTLQIFKPTHVIAIYIVSKLGEGWWNKNIVPGNWGKIRLRDKKIKTKLICKTKLKLSFVKHINTTEKWGVK